MTDVKSGEMSVAAIAELGWKSRGIDIVTIKNSSKIPGVPDEVPAAILHGDSPRLESVEDILKEYAERPKRVQLHSYVNDKTSFVEFIKRFKTDNLVMFAELNGSAVAKVKAVFNYTSSAEKGLVPDFADSFVIYQMEYSPAAQAWMENDREDMTQAQFAKFLEDRVPDVVNIENSPQEVKDFVGNMLLTPASPADLMGLAKGMSLTVRRKISDAINLDNGEFQINFEETHTGNGKGNDPLIVPNVFLIGIELFNGDEIVYLPVRLSYRVDGALIKWSYRIVRFLDTVQRMKRTVINEIAKEVDVPVYFN